MTVKPGTVLPNSVADLTPEWLTKVLRESGALGSGRVTSIHPVDVHGGVALMSQMLRLLLGYDGDTPEAPESLIAKFPPTDVDSHSRGLELGFFEGEACFYGQLASQTTIRAPRCYYSRFDADTGRFLILLEDLSAARLGNVRVGCTDPEAALGVETLARLHASWWNSDSLAEFAWLRRFEGRLETIVGLLPVAWPTFAQRFRARLEPDQFELLLEVNERFNCSQRIRFHASQTLLHGDFKLDNLFFLASGEMVVCDWGLVMAGPAMFDVASFMALNLTVEQLRRLDLDLIRRYVATLEAEGVRDYEVDTALADFRPHLVAFLPRLIGAGGLAQFTDEDAMDEYALGLRRVVSAIGDHGGLDDRLWA